MVARVAKGMFLWWFGGKNSSKIFRYQPCGERKEGEKREKKSCVFTSMNAWYKNTW